MHFALGRFCLLKMSARWGCSTPAHLLSAPLCAGTGQSSAPSRPRPGSASAASLRTGSGSSLLGLRRLLLRPHAYVQPLPPTASALLSCIATAQLSAFPCFEICFSFYQRSLDRMLQQRRNNVTAAYLRL